MNLDPTVSPWIGIVASTGVCLWMAAVGLPLSRAVFGDRPRPVWPFYAPALGIVVVLLVTNLSAYLIPGAPSAWFGLLAPSIFSAAVAWRGGATRRLSRAASVSLVAMAAASTGVFVLALINRTQVWYVDGSWHFAVILRMARGVFPPVTPYGPDAGLGYHYGADFMASSLVNVAAAPSWTALYVVQAFLVTVLFLAAIGLAYDLGAPLPLAGGIGSVLIFFPGEFSVGFVGPFEEPVAGDPIRWLVAPAQALAVSLVLLVAAALEARPTRRRVAALAAASGVFALAEAALLIFSSVALAFVGWGRLIGGRGRERRELAAALVIAAALAAFAGGPMSDAIFGRGGTAGMARVEFDPRLDDLLPFQFAGVSLIQIGIIPLSLIGAIVAFRRRSWGLGYLAVCGMLGLVAAEFVQSPLARNDGRIVRLATAVAMFTALTAVGTQVGALHGTRKYLAGAALALLALVPTGLPRAVASLQLAFSGPYVQCPVDRNPEICFPGRMRFGPEIERNWDFYVWLAQFLPNDARLLTPYPAAAASLAGVASPTSGRDPQALAAYLTPVYDDALRFLHRDDLADLGITYLHLTDAWASVLTPRAQRLFDDPDQFKLVAERRSVSGQRHRIYSVAPSAGTREASPSSFRSLRRRVPLESSLFLSRALSVHQLGSLLFLFIDNQDLRAPPAGFLDRATRIPRYKPNTHVPETGIVFLPGAFEPNTLGLSAGDAVWTGYGMRAYDLTSAWSRVWRIGAEFQGLPAAVRHICDAARGRLELRVLGQPGTEVVAGPTAVRLTGTPQQTLIDLPTCDAPVLFQNGEIAPFAQIRPQRADLGQARALNTAGLGYDGGAQHDRAIVNVWYRNPTGLPFATGTELRLYQAGRSGVAPAHPNPRSSVRWWKGPIFLAPETQMARIEFDAARLEINGTAGVGDQAELELGRTYVLVLTVAGADPKDGYVEVQRQVPLVQVVVNEHGVSYDVLSGIVGIENRRPGGERLQRRDGLAIGWIHDLTPQAPAPTAAP